MPGIRLVTVALLVASGCTHEAGGLRPTSEAQPQEGAKDAARAESAGVVMVASGNAWKGQPENLERDLTPVLVHLENHSGRPLRLEYGAFSLVGGESRFKYAAVPPLVLSPNLSSGQGVGGAGRGETLDLGAAGAYRQGDPHNPFIGSYGPYYPNTTGGGRCADPLPSSDMLAKALPEGTLIDGGQVSGFLFFQGVATRESQVVLQARLVDENSGELFGSLDIPFQVRK
ncbi:hypothetical protein JY651_44320 [Pyxidicoccus parkwayensis]|jgi:hypothetical protein|uniref:Lipoprotein n=1 Tax=Pyxidicoccus parkwayensis TaxID=2813578 RepID=A0ABX7NT97_9BACT|nr:hypothetical protein [Pyxidicoccus parkwaysis]QSQ22092.1 hypothetical protein JY651_44320 [Pyxidicoccus parkwaysis]